MSVRSLRFSIRFFLKHFFHSLRTREQWFEVKHYGWKIYRELTQPIRAVYYVFWRMWKYRILLWNDFDWDEGFLLSILETKFLNMMKYHRDHSHVEGNVVTTHELRECAEICYRLQNKNYYTADLDAAHDAKWGKLEVQWTPADYDKLGRPLTHRMDFMRDNATTEELKNQELQEQREIWATEERLKQADLDRLAELIRTRMETWWD